MRMVGAGVAAAAVGAGAPAGAVNMGVAGGPTLRFGQSSAMGPPLVALTQVDSRRTRYPAHSRCQLACAPLRPAWQRVCWQRMAIHRQPLIRGMINSFIAWLCSSLPVILEAHCAQADPGQSCSRYVKRSPDTTSATGVPPRVLAILRNCWLQAQPCPSAHVVRQQRDVRMVALQGLMSLAENETSMMVTSV